MMDLSIIIPTKDRGRIFDTTLQAALNAARDIRAEIIVVNDSKTSSVRIPEPSQGVRLIHNPSQGVASARNLGAREASGEVILFLDDDIIISETSLRHIMNVHREKSGIALNPDWTYPPMLLNSLKHTPFGRFLMAHNMTTFQGWYADAGWKEGALFSSLSVASFHLSMRRTDFLKTGGYDEQFPWAGFEDYDFPRRLTKANVSFFIDTRIVVHHNEEDRIQLRTWLDNQERRAVTRTIAIQRGYPELTLHYPLAKRTLLFLLLTFYPVILVILKFIPHGIGMDPLEFRLISALQAAKIFKGYSAGMNR